MWNKVLGMLFFKIFLSFLVEICIGQDLQKIWKINEELIDMYNSPKPNFLKQDVRISHAKCKEYIWDITNEEEIERKKREYQRNFPGFVSVVAGRDAEPGEFPHMGAVGWKATKGEGEWLFLCGSFLISEEFMLTAAHCHIAPHDEKLVDRLPKIVRLGVENIMKPSQRRPKDIKILKFIKHPQYSGALYKYYDIALIRLRERVDFNKYVRPACILKQEVTRATVTGWGFVEPGQFSEHKNISAHLQSAQVDIIDRKTCMHKLRNKIRKGKRLLDHQICAIDINGTADTCFGDSGGPLQVKMDTNTDTSIYNVVAVTSFGFTCGSNLFPSIYTRISNFIDWIEENVWKDELSKVSTNSEPSVENPGKWIHKVILNNRIENEIPRRLPLLNLLNSL